jgi:ABC-type lipoprotein release transport system permease subunit
MRMTGFLASLRQDFHFAARTIAVRPALVALAVSYIPAMRAAAIEPMAALRNN